MPSMRGGGGCSSREKTTENERDVRPRETERKRVGRERDDLRQVGTPARRVRSLVRAGTRGGMGEAAVVCREDE
ncbi:hypothetical protein Sjap_010327 [Stephania japonica]|uniref:Uncharacterized protein n=1 Tax=Stephania japonica TaxID=461633 RepID=A0AAP0JAZ8_9MAGN